MHADVDAAVQVRLEAMDRVVALSQEPGAADNTAVLVQAMAHLPSWDEKNFQVRVYIRATCDAASLSCSPLLWRQVNTTGPGHEQIPCAGALCR